MKRFRYIIFGIAVWAIYELQSYGVRLLNESSSTSYYVGLGIECSSVIALLYATHLVFKEDKNHYERNQS